MLGGQPYPRFEPGPGRYIALLVVGAVLGGLLVWALQPGAAPSLPGPLGAQVGSPPSAPARLDELSQALVRVAEQVGPSVVGVVNRQRVVDLLTGRVAVVDAGVGSGVVFDRRGYIVTNAHVVEGADALDVVVAGGQRIPARLVATDAPYSDLAVIQVVSGPALTPARFGDSDQVRVGEIVLAIGNPKGLDFFRSVSMGVVSGIRTDLLQRLAERGGPYPEGVRIFKVIQTDAAINEGNSGGALVNLRGEVIGITTLKLVGEGTEGMGFAIPSNDVRTIASDLIRQGYVSRPALGVSLAREEVARSQYGVTRGLLVVQVVPGGPADRAGIRPGDVIVRLGDVEVNTFIDLLKALARYRVGDRVPVTVLRGGRSLTVTVVLGELQAMQSR